MMLWASSFSKSSLTNSNSKGSDVSFGDIDEDDFEDSTPENDQHKKARKISSYNETGKKEDNSLEETRKMFFLYLLENFCIKNVEVFTTSNNQSPTSPEMFFKLLCKKLAEVGVLESVEFLEKIEFYREKYMKSWTNFLTSAFKSNPFPFTTFNLSQNNHHSSSPTNDRKQSPVEKRNGVSHAKGTISSEEDEEEDEENAGGSGEGGFKSKATKSKNCIVKSVSTVDLRKTFISNQPNLNTISLSISQEELSNPPTNNLSRYQNDFIEEEKLGQGGFGAVFKVFRTLDQLHYAIKKIKFRRTKSPLKLPEKVAREVRCLAHSEHINVVRYYNAWLEYHIVAPSPPKTSSISEYQKKADHKKRKNHHLHDDKKDNKDNKNNKNKKNDNNNHNMINNKNKKSNVDHHQQKAKSSYYDYDNLPFLPSSSSSQKNQPLQQQQQRQSYLLGPPHYDDYVDGDDDDDDDSVYSPFRADDDDEDLNFHKLQKKNSNLIIHNNNNHNKNNVNHINNNNQNQNHKIVKKKNDYHQYLEDEDFNFTPDRSTSETESSESSLSGGLIFGADDDDETPVNSITTSNDNTDDNDFSKTLSSCDHPVEFQVTLYIQMQLCSFSLKEWLENESRVVDQEENIVIFKQILEGLNYIHSLGLIHRDLKPSNIFVTNYNNEGHLKNSSIKLGDFGVATFLDDESRLSFSDRDNSSGGSNNTAFTSTMSQSYSSGSGFAALSSSINNNNNGSNFNYSSSFNANSNNIYSSSYNSGGGFMLPKPMISNPTLNLNHNHHHPPHYPSHFTPLHSNPSNNIFNSGSGGGGSGGFGGGNNNPSGGGGGNNNGGAKRMVSVPTTAPIEIKGDHRRASPLISPFEIVPPSPVPSNDFEKRISSSFNQMSRTTGIGTVAYASPEQLRKDVYDQKTDIYSLGIILLELYYPFYTKMERSRVLDDLRNKRLLPIDFQKSYPLEAELVLKLTNPVPDLRPCANEILRMDFLSTNVSAHQFLLLTKQLEEKDKELARCKEEIKLLQKTIECNDVYY